MEISKCLSFSKASRNLHISQPGLSQQISALEKELGFRLLNRTTRKITLTEEGEFIYKNFSSHFEEIENTINFMVKNKTIPKPLIKIATVPSAASIYIPKILKRVPNAFPEVEFYLYETTSSKATELVKQQNYHIAFIRTPINIDNILEEGLLIAEFKRYPLQLIVSINHPLAMKNSIDLKEAYEEPFIHYDYSQAHSLQYLLEKACLAAGFSPKKLCTGSELMTIANLVSNNLGVALLPKDMISLIETTKLKVLDINDLKLTSSISVIWKDHEDTTPVMNNILKYLKAEK